MNIYSALFETNDPSYKNGFYSLQGESLNDVYDKVSKIISADAITDKLLIRILVIHNGDVIKRIPKKDFIRIKTAYLDQLNIDSSTGCCPK